MKTLILISLAVLMSIIATPRAQAIFGQVAIERDRRQHAEQRAAQEQQTNGRLYVAISILSVGVAAALLVGAAAGSKARRDANQL